MIIFNNSEKQKKTYLSTVGPGEESVSPLKTVFCRVEINFICDVWCVVTERFAADWRVLQSWLGLKSPKTDKRLKILQFIGFLTKLLSALEVENLNYSLGQHHKHLSKNQNYGIWCKVPLPFMRQNYWTKNNK